MEIVIGHLYYDLANLYGENANVKALIKNLEFQGIDVIVKKFSIDDKIDFSKLDMVYIGTAMESYQKIILRDLKKYKDDLKNFVSDNKVLLATGNALELFGKNIKFLDEDIEGLDIFDYSTIHEIPRIVKEVEYDIVVDKNIIGFVNHLGRVNNNEANNGIYKYNNFYGTYILGPILVRNPQFLEYILKNLIMNKDPNFNFRKFDFSCENNAYEEYLKFKIEKNKKIHQK